MSDGCVNCAPCPVCGENSSEREREIRRLVSLLRRVHEELVPGCGEFGLTDEQAQVIAEVTAEASRS